MQFTWISKKPSIRFHKNDCYKLSALGIKGTLLNWIRSFLSDWSEIVVVGGKKSDSKKMISGVPQGSCLAPLLFISYVNDIDDCVTSSKIQKYADDLKIYAEFSSSNKQQAYRSLQSDLNSLVNWSRNWQLNFNISKCSVLHFGNNNPCQTYHLNGQDLLSNLSFKWPRSA